ncbi:MAG TPA: transketolase family protein [Fervidobacterium sp.]|nr:transketolase family protein [Fervidobacterium sp.]HPT54239.1 transketolase family protein [Fervidobacterium sp.]HPZ17539.1 transketolase family protein [Fervidobacterium sp.]HQE49334.1 transketolase family protein [Fervidobacterium sp.]HUM42376.1 transketolase family protein [Fervidobacterium sp.]
MMNTKLEPTYDEKELRDVYGQLLFELASKDKRVVVLNADLARSDGTLKFKELFPERFIDVGVAEANMMGIAAGLANMGMIPITHTFTPFSTRRAFDQITISIAYSDLPVKLMGTDPGVTAELNGGTHMSFEDAGIMRTLPNIVIVEPADAVQFKSLFEQIIYHPKPVYTRMYRRRKERFFDEDMQFEIGKIATLKDGSDITIISSGLMVGQSMIATRMLEERGISVRLLNMHTLKPVDKETIIKAARETGKIVVAENHNIINGWGSAVAEVLAENYPVPMRRVGVQDHFGEVGLTDFLLKKYHMTAQDIYEKAIDLLNLKA